MNSRAELHDVECCLCKNESQGSQQQVQQVDTSSTANDLASQKCKGRTARDLYPPQQELAHTPACLELAKSFLKP